MTTAVTIAPSKLSNVMALPSQAGAGVKIERRDGKGRHANGNENKVESEAKHWRSFRRRGGDAQERFHEHHESTQLFWPVAIYRELIPTSPENAPG